MFGRAAKISRSVALAKPVSAQDRHCLGHQQRKFAVRVGGRPAAFSASGVSILRTARPTCRLAPGNLHIHLLRTSFRSQAGLIPLYSGPRVRVPALWAFLITESLLVVIAIV